MDLSAKLFLPLLGLCLFPKVSFGENLICLRNLPAHMFSEGSSESELEPIETDRHDFTMSPRTVGAGVVQVEGGYSYFYKDENDEIESSHTTPEWVTRIGLTEDLELRVRWNYAWQFRNGEEELNDLDSAEDIRYGLKLALTEHNGWIPESAVRIIGSSHTGGSDFTTNRAQFGMDLVYEWKNEADWSLAGSTGFGTDGVGEFSLASFASQSLTDAEGEDGGRDRFTAIAQSVALGMPITERMELYLEYFGIFSHGLQNEFNLNFFNTGVDYLLSPDLVIDVRVGAGLNEQADDFFVGVGGAYRFR